MNWFVRKITWFTIVGVASSLLYAGSVSGGVELLGLSPLIGHGIGLIFAATCSYLGHHYLTFQADGRHSIYIPRFIAQATLTTILSTTAIVTADGMHYSYIFAVMITVFIIPIINFILMQLWVFSSNKTHETSSCI